MRKGFLVWQCAAWLAVAALALYWQDRIMSAEPTVYHAIRAVKVAIDRNARDQYVSQMKAFAQAFHFTTRLSQTSPDPNDIVVHMERDDVWMVGEMASKFGAPDLAYEVAVYSSRGRPVAPASLDPLVEGLKLHLGKVAGAVVTDTK